MGVQLGCPRGRDNPQADILPLNPSAWTWVDLPLPELSGRSKGGKLRKGDLLDSLTLFTTGEGGTPVFWDRLELVERVGP